MPPKRKATAAAEAPAPKRRAPPAKATVKKPVIRRAAPVVSDSEDELAIAPSRSREPKKKGKVCAKCKGKKEGDLAQCSKCAKLGMYSSALPIAGSDMTTVHPACDGLGPEAAKIIRTYDWQCNACTECEECLRDDHGVRASSLMAVVVNTDRPPGRPKCCSVIVATKHGTWDAWSLRYGKSPRATGSATSVRSTKKH